MLFNYGFSVSQSSIISQIRECCHVLSSGLRRYGLDILAVLSFRSPAANSASRSSPSVDEQVTRDLNLGKAFYENPTTQAEAVAEFKKALDLRPDSVREQLNYGLALLRAAKTQEGRGRCSRRCRRKIPKLPHTWFNLGIYYKRQGHFDKALEQLQQMVKLVPDEADHALQPRLHLQAAKQDTSSPRRPSKRRAISIPAWPLRISNCSTSTGRKTGCRKPKSELALFRERKQAQDNDGHSRKKMSNGASTPKSTSRSSRSRTRRKQPRALCAERAELGRCRRRSVRVDGSRSCFGTGGCRSAGIFEQRHSDLIRAARRKLQHTGLDALRGVTAVVPGDFNNDGLPDLCVIANSGASLYENKKGTFAKSSFSLPAGQYNGAVWIDFDHDYDLDLMLLGKKSVLLRNQGTQGFAPHPFPFAEGEAIDAVRLPVGCGQQVQGHRHFL